MDKYKHTCHQLGVCQHRYLHCYGCINDGNASMNKRIEPKPKSVVVVGKTPTKKKS